MVPPKYHTLLVGGDLNMNVIFPYFGNFIIPTDELIFFRGVGMPPTREMSASETAEQSIVPAAKSRLLQWNSQFLWLNRCFYGKITQILCGVSAQEINLSKLLMWCILTRSIITPILPTQPDIDIAHGQTYPSHMYTVNMFVHVYREYVCIFITEYIHIHIIFQHQHI